MQLMGIPLQRASRCGDVLCIPSLQVEVNLKRSSCLSVMWGVLVCYHSWGVFLLKRYFHLLLFLSWKRPFPPCLLENLKLWLQLGALCSVAVCRLLSRKAWKCGCCCGTTPTQHSWSTKASTGGAVWFNFIAFIL